MKLNQFLHGVGNPMTYYPGLIDIAGGVEECIVLCQLIYWSDKARDADGWLYKTARELEQETGLSRYRQDKARKELISRGLIEEKRSGLPARTYFRVRFEVLNEAWDKTIQFADPQQSSLSTLSNQVCRPSANLIVDPQQSSLSTVSNQDCEGSAIKFVDPQQTIIRSTENTTEITAEITTELGAPAPQDFSLPPLSDGTIPCRLSGESARDAFSRMMKRYTSARDEAGVLGWLVYELLGVPPNYGRLMRFYQGIKRNPKRFAALVHQAAGMEIVGDPLDYLQKLSTGGTPQRAAGSPFRGPNDLDFARYDEDLK